MWLRDEYSARPVLPDESGTFKFEEPFSPYTVFHVEGSEASSPCSSSTVRPESTLQYPRFRLVSMGVLCFKCLDIVDVYNNSVCMCCDNK